MHQCVHTRTCTHTPSHSPPRGRSTTTTMIVFEGIDSNSSVVDLERTSSMVILHFFLRYESKFIFVCKFSWIWGAPIGKLICLKQALGGHEWRALWLYIVVWLTVTRKATFYSITKSFSRAADDNDPVELATDHPTSSSQATAHTSAPKFQL